ncbi:MAG: twin-arginine translocase TatA/TatE family subunit [Acidimicrobiia bacterium]
MFRQIGAGEILLILAVLILLFGAKKLPELARSLGKSARELRKGMEDDTDEEDDDEEDDDKPAATGIANDDTTDLT